MATIGILGGMGPMATMAFYQMLINAQTIKTEQDYLDTIIYSKTSIPDRTAFILGRSYVSPVNSLMAAATALEQAGAGFIAIPCVTSHYFYDEIAKAVNIPVINMPEELAAYVKSRGITSVGLLATDGTVQSRVLHNAMEPLGINVITPDSAGQQFLMELIYGIKQGQRIIGESFATVESTLYSHGAQNIILGCTELTLVKDEMCPESIDVLDVLVQAALKLGSKL
ncbi:MAG: amino acid racemase [Firmicutes bacterium]|nr:amino acid racemase [Bacillota bacterium]